MGRYSDVYALGGILYHLLTARPPFQADSLEVIISQVLTAEPVSPRMLNASVPRDLETICLKCLEKEPSRRYASAQGVADELGRFLRSEPILARPVGLAGKAGRWCRRKPALATVVGLLLLVATVGLAAVLSQWRAAVTARAQSEHERYRAGISAAQTLIEHSQLDQARDILAREGVEARRGWEWGWLQRLAHQDLMRLDHNSAVTDLAFSPDERYLLTGSLDGSATLWELATGRLVHLLRPHTKTVASVAFNADGTQFLTASSDGTARVFDIRRGEQKLVIRDSGELTKAAFGPTNSSYSQIVVTVGVSAGLKLWDVHSGGMVRVEAPDQRGIETFDFSPDGRQLAFVERGRSYAYGTDYCVTVLDLNDQQRRSFNAHRLSIKAVRYNRQGTLLATASADGSVRLWNSATGEGAQPLQAPFGRAQFFDVDFSPDGRWLVASEVGPQIAQAQIFEVNSGRWVRSVAGHSLGISRTTFSPSGKRFATAGYDGAACVWSVETPREFLSLEGHDQAVWALALSSDGKRLASGSFDLTARIWDADTGSLLTTIPVGFYVVSLAFSPDGARLATVATNNTAMVWTTNAEPVLTLAGHTGIVMAVAWSLDGRFILNGSQDGTVRLWNPTNGTPLRTFVCHTNWVLSVSLSPDGRRFATSSSDGMARIWDSATGRLLHELKGHRGLIQTVSFSPDGHRVATGCEDRRVRLFDVDRGSLMLVMEGHRGGVTSLAFSPDGSRLVSAAANADFGSFWTFDRRAIIWDLRGGQRMMELDAHPTSVTALAFSPDGKRLASASVDNTIRIREAFPWRLENLPEPSNASLAERLETYKRRYWQERLQSEVWTVPLGAPIQRPGRRVLNLFGIDFNLAAERGSKTRPMGRVPPRDPRTAPDLIDLTSLYNLTLSEPVQPILRIFDLHLRTAPSALQPGVNTWYGVSFDVRGVIQLSRAALAYEIFPTEVEITVARKFHRLHVLHGAKKSSKNGTQAGTYRLHYRDDGSESLAIIYGQDVLDSQEPTGDLPNARVVTFPSDDPTNLANPTDSKTHYFVRTYENPHPERDVARITFESAMSSTAPLLLAMTVEP